MPPFSVAAGWDSHVLPLLPPPQGDGEALNLMEW